VSARRISSARAPEFGGRHRRPQLRGLSALGLLLAMVGSAVLFTPQVSAAAQTPESHHAEAPAGWAQAHDVAGFPGTSTSAPFNECPAIGYDASCGILIVVTNSGNQILQDPNNGAPGAITTPGTPTPYDENEDTLVGIVNESSKPVYALQLSGEQSGNDLFGFDGDGICTYGTDGGSTDDGGDLTPGTPVPGAGGYTGDSYCSVDQKLGAGAPNGPDPNGSDYQGPNNTFSNISADTTSGDVNFDSPIVPGGSSYFSLEESLESSDVAVTFGYWLVASDGGIFAYDAPYFGSMGGKPLHAPIVGIAADPQSGGYWEVASDGGLFAFNAPFFGSMGGKPLDAPIVGMVATPDGGGYWEVASDGGIFAFGDAGFYGSMGGRHLNKPIIGISCAPDGLGYYEVATDGGLFNFGPGTAFQGSMGGQPLNKPVVGIVSGSSGYQEVASDGGLFAFNAPFFGSPASTPLNNPVVGMAATPDGGGYWEVASDGGVFNYGDALFWGSLGATHLNAPVVGIAASNT